MNSGSNRINDNFNKIQDSRYRYYKAKQMKNAFQI